MPVNVFKNNDGIVNKHTDCKCNSGKAYHVQISAKSIHDDERSYHADRDCGCNHDSRRDAAQEKDQNDDCQYSTDQDVSLYEVYCSPDVRSLVIYPLETDILRVQFFLVEKGNNFLNPVCEIKDIRTRLRLDAYRDTVFRIMDHCNCAFLIPELSIPDIRHCNSPLSGRSEDNLFNFLRRVELSHCAYPVITPPHADSARRNIHVFSLQDCN